MYPRQYNAAEYIAEGLKLYGEKGWGAELIFRMLMTAQGQCQYVQDQWRKILMHKTSLLDPRDQPYLTRAQIVSTARNLKYFKDYKVEPSAARPPRTQWFKNDDEAIEYLTIRTKSDLSIRRARIMDYRGLITLAQLNELKQLDYIHVCNCMAAIVVHGPEILDVWKAMDMLDSFDGYIRGANALNQVAKKMRITMADRLQLAELGNLTGYRQPPVPGFDIVKETKALAEAGETHGIYQWETVFQEAAADVMAKQHIPEVKWITLEEYVRADLASTAGASSIGKVKYEYQGKVEKFKARKNLLYDILTSEEIYKIVVASYPEQTATAFVKPELGKLRIAVTGDIANYYVTSWLNYLAGHCYTTWEGNTLEESSDVQMARMERTLNELRDAFSLPFDYAGFDHQPTMSEIKWLVRVYLECALVNTPTQFRVLVQGVIDTVVESFSNSVVIVWEAGKKWTFKVTGGVQSGIRLTSLLGNFWNQTITQVVTKILRLDAVKAKYLRGDDSSIIAVNYLSVLLFRLGYAALNARGHDAKYGIHYQETEFLRIWYANDRCYGYPNRAIPGINQRKPWTAEAWASDSVIESQLRTVRTIERRMGTAQLQLERMVTQAWARKRKTDIRYLRLPKYMGGLGLLPWHDEIVDVPYPSVDRVEVRFEVAPGTNLRYGEKLQADIPLTRFELTEEELSQMQQRAMNDKVSTDDVPGYNKIQRNMFKEALDEFVKKTKTWRTLQISTPVLDLTAGLMGLVSKNEVKDLVVRPARRFFGKYKYHEKEWRSLAELSRYRDLDMKEEYSKYTWGFFEDRRLLEKRGMHRSQATDWLFGKIERPSVIGIHDQAVHIIEPYVSAVVESYLYHKWSRWTLTRFVQDTWISAERMIKKSRLYERLLQY